jgi:hypothetical protein
VTATRRVKVRCAGRPVVTRSREDPTDYDELPSCGWSGERAAGPNTTRRPCPDCGGRVELVGRTPDPTLAMVARRRLHG